MFSPRPFAIILSLSIIFSNTIIPPAALLPAVILPLINDLHSNAMRTRHWAALARVCNVKTVDPTESR